MTVRATTTRHTAPLSDDFGLSYATRLFGEAALADLPRYTRGPRAGSLKGYVLWIKAETGGWSPYGVAYPNSTIRAWIGAGPYAAETDALSGQWLGRVQYLCGSACYLGEKNRAEEMERQALQAAADKAHWAEIKAEMGQGAQ